MSTSVAFSPDGGCLISSDYTGNRFAWDVRTGERLREVPALPVQPETARSSDGRTFAWRDGPVIRLIDLRLSQVNRVPKSPRLRNSLKEPIYRRRVTRPDPAWHAAEAQRLALAGEWFAAAFHLRLRPPDAAPRH